MSQQLNKPMKKLTYIEWYNIVEYYTPTPKVDTLFLSILFFNFKVKVNGIRIITRRKNIIIHISFKHIHGNQ